MNIKSILQNRVAKNAGWLMGGKIAQMIISLLVGTLTARFLGPANYGLINYGAAYVAFFTSLCTLGINSIGHPRIENPVPGKHCIINSIMSGQSYE